MNKNLTDITLVVDRSGSMEANRQEAENAINQYIADQAKLPGDVTVTIVQFDDKYEFVEEGTPIKDVKPFQLVPRGWTALLDAVGRAIRETGSRLEKISEADRPGLVLFVIMTDGLENASREFKRPQVKQMIDEQHDKYSWQFTYLGANQDAIAVGAQIGIGSDASLTYGAQHVGAAMRSLSHNTTRMREAATSGGIVQNSYTDQERKLSQ